MKNVRFLGEEYLFGGNSLDEQGFIATREQFENFEASFAHYTPALGVMRFGTQIGTRADLEIVSDAGEPEQKVESAINMLTHPSWPWGSR